MARKFEVVTSNKDATVLKSKNGKKIVLKTPTGKFKQYGRELNSGVNSKGQKLTASQVGYRVGYRAALGEQSKIYNNTLKKRSY